MRAEDFEEQGGSVAARLATGLAKIALALRQEDWHVAHAAGLSPTQAQLLIILQRRAAATLQDLATELGVGAPTASEALGALARKGLVRKGRSRADGRALAVFLTPAGQREAKRLAVWPDLLAETLDELAPEEQEVLLRSVVRMILALQRRGRIPVVRLCATCRFFRPNVHDDAERPHHCGFVDAPFGNRSMRLDCPDHQPAA